MFMLILILFFSVLISSKNFLLLLLNLELLALLVYFMLSLNNIFMLNYNFCLFYIIFSVCESCLGLGLLILLLRNYGNDLLNNFILLI